ncbi:MAG TPA: bifunctional (p)ppGpp synthetase/guanosine-3',5'-bis(diphosphate) 3'-pyrophosphohydrolase [Gammaproteobacteria bacterium]
MITASRHGSIRRKTMTDMNNFSPESPSRALLATQAPAFAERGERLGGIIADLGLQPEIAAAAMLLHAHAAGALSFEDIENACGKAVAELAKGAAALPRPGEEPDLDGAHPEPRAQAENIRKMLLAMVQDIRTIVIRLADELLRLRELKSAPAAEQRRAARLVLEIYAPLANRLGIWQLKWELEDLAFRYAEPETYKRIAKALNEKRREREAYINAVIAELRNLLDINGIAAQVKGRPKHIYSIWKKMQRKDLDLDALYDLRAVRVLVESVKDCYAVLGLVHGRWRHVPKEFDDYIATPKGNNYRSLHTAVFGPEDRPVEIQIRTQDMHHHAELGVAAHWRYKEGGGRDVALEEKVAWLRQLLESEGGDFIDRFQDEVFEERIYVLTPRGAVIDLPARATPVDFAYHVHTEIGHRCRGAKVNGRIVPLTQELQTGDRVEIITVKRGEPSRDWLNPQAGYARSGRARDKIRYWFRQQSHDENLARGKAMLEREIARLGMQDISAEDLARHLRLHDADAVHLALGAGDLSVVQIGNALQRLGGLAEPPSLPARKTRRARPENNLRVSGVDDVLTHFARCCQPVPPDSVRGYITRGRGVSVHRGDCPHLLHLESREPGRIVAIDWSDEQAGSYPVDVLVDAQDRQGLLRDVAGAMADQKVSILAMNAKHAAGAGNVVVDLTLEIRDLGQLGRLLNRLNGIGGVYEAKRKLTA